MDEALPPFSAWAGPRSPRILFVAEAWGESEAKLRQPLVGSSGQEFWRMLGEAWPEVEPELHAEASAAMRFDLAWVAKRAPWLEAASVAMTNVLNLRPPANNLEALCAKKEEVGGRAYSLPPLIRGKYLRPEYLPELSRLYAEISLARPNLVIALGNTATWALLRATNIGSIRGATALARLQCPGGLQHEVKVLPTYHPAGVLRQWNWRPIVLADLMKGLRQGASPTLERPRREIIINPSIEEVERWTAETLAKPPSHLGNDIETGWGQIKCMSFARSPREALVVPFIDQSRPDWNYWPTPSLELRAWRACGALLAAKHIRKLGQNWSYDLQYEMRLGLRIEGGWDDTMLFHHALFPEMLKGLGFLGSVYTDEASWKLMRTQKADTEKYDE